MQPSLDVDLAAFLQVFAGDFRQALPEHDIVPLGAVLPLAALILVTFVGGYGELGHRCAAGGVLDFGVLAKIADENNFVDAFACHECCSFCPASGNERRARKYPGMKAGLGIIGLEVEYIRRARVSRSGPEVGKVALHHRAHREQVAVCLCVPCGNSPWIWHRILLWTGGREDGAQNFSSHVYIGR